MHLYRRLPKQWNSTKLIHLIDIGLFITTFLLFVTEHTVLFIHIIFVLLSIGAFFWNFRDFTFRSLFLLSFFPVHSSSFHQALLQVVSILQ